MQKKIFKFGLVGILLIFIGILIVVFIVPDAEYNAELIFPPEVSEDKIKELLEEFEREKIPYKVKKSVIYYPKKYDKIALEISDKVIFVKDPSPGMKFTYNEHKEYFIELLKKEKIPYSIDKDQSQGEEWVFWNIKDDDRVQKLRLKLYEKMGITKQPPKIFFNNEMERESLAKLLQKENISFRLGELDRGNNKAKLIFIEYNWKDFAEVQKLEEKLYNTKD